LTGGQKVGGSNPLTPILRNKRFQAILAKNKRRLIASRAGTKILAAVQMAKKRSRNKRSRIIQSKPGIVLPNSGIARPPTPYERRIRNQILAAPPFQGEQNEDYWAQFARRHEWDVIGQERAQRELEERSYWLLARAKGGSGLVLANQLRFYVVEYCSRILAFGSGGFPSSFNVVESFLQFTPKYLAFDNLAKPSRKPSAIVESLRFSSVNRKIIIAGGRNSAPCRVDTLGRSLYPLATFIRTTRL